MILLYLLKYQSITFTSDIYNYFADRFLTFDVLLHLDEVYRICLGVLIFLHILALLKHVSFNFHLFLMRATIINARGSLLSSVLLIGIGILAFSSLEFLYSGRTTYAYRDMHNAIASLVCSTVSMAKLSLNSGSERTEMNNVVFVLFCLIVNFILINLLVSILNETMSMIKSGAELELNGDSYDSDLNQHALKKIWNFFSICGGKVDRTDGKLYLSYIC